MNVEEFGQFIEVFMPLAVLDDLGERVVQISTRGLAHLTRLPRSFLPTCRQGGMRTAFC